MTEKPTHRLTLAASILSGGLYVLCFPKFNLGFLAWAAFIPFLLARPVSVRSAFGSGWLAGFAANLGTLYWIYPTCRAAQVDPFTSAAAVMALAAYLALYWGAFGTLRVFFAHGFGGWSPILLAAGWTALEWLRTHALTGFPWLLFGYSQWEYPPLIAIAEWGGAYAVSFSLMLFNAAAAALLRDAKEKRWNAGARLLPSTACLLVFAAATFYLARRAPGPAGEPVSVAVAQGNIDQYKKWDAAYEREVRDAYASLTQEASLHNPDLIVWPETAVPGWIPNEPRYVEWLANLARQSSTHLLVGAASHQEGKDYNAVFLISSTGTILQQYRKRHLVPFGEVVPFKNLLARWIRVMNELGEMTKSDNWTVFQLDAGTRGPGSGGGNNEARPASGPVYFSANICFESLFPGLVRGFVRRGAGLTFNLTNDGWFLETAAPEQHFIASVFRAVETRTWVVRAANTGISGFIDPDGRVRSRTGLTERAMLRGSPRPTFRRTLYTRTGDAFALLCALTAATCLFLASRTARRPSSRRSLDSSPTHR